MFIRNSSALKKIKYTLIHSCLAATFLVLLISVESAAQPKLNLAEPLKRCSVYGGSSGLARIIASDNDKDLVISPDNFSLVSIHTESNAENWKSLSGGRLESETADGENLFFVASFDIENRQKSYTLNSVSLKTGISKWQIKLNEHSKVRLSRVESHELVYLLIDDNFVSAVRKVDGSINWTKEYSEPLISVTKSDLNAQELFIVSMNSLKRVLAKSGELIEEIKFKKGEITTAVIGKGYVLNGYPTGEITKISAADSQSDVLWKIKAGGGISGLALYEDEVLVTSLDNFIYLYSAQSGKLRWKRRVAGRINFKPQIYGDLAVVVNSGDNSVSVLDLRDGKIVNQVQLEPETYFTSQPIVSGRQLILQTSRGIYFFSNAGAACK